VHGPLDLRVAAGNGIGSARVNVKAAKTRRERKSVPRAAPAPPGGSAAVVGQRASVSITRSIARSHTGQNAVGFRVNMMQSTLGR